ncbi:MAG: hypothetical protein NDI63_08295 [Pseudobdellovibrio sp.]|uniref:hypothetical protein n=1 Tax=Pseudobdellovibrio sp. HCB154 TaxID=3386277 RepID=UPI003916E27F|nr:hypothetical protein [Pseudobdellovibrio sp.]
MKPKDLITEEDFTRKTAGHVPKSPQRDSPGDSAANQNLEVEMGINYDPEEEPRSKRKKDIPAFDKSH